MKHIKLFEEYKEPEGNIKISKADFDDMDFDSKKALLTDTYPSLEFDDMTEKEFDEYFDITESLNEAAIVVTSIKDIKDIQKKVDAGQVTYRGLGMGKLSNDFYKLAGESGTRIKVDGKEYYITDTDFRKLAWDEKKKGWNGKIRFAAPSRRG
jgi:hypothetical protein